MSTERLLEIKKQIESAKTKHAGIQGQIKEIESQMFSRFKVKTVSEASDTVAKLGEELDKLNHQFNEGMEKLEDAHPWD
jgi:uncharacterized coiled-coil protein SlyX